MSDETKNRGLRSIGAILPSEFKSGSLREGSRQAKSNAATYSEVKQQWSTQVAADSALSGVALRIALALPEWLNRETLLAWPAQSTIASVINVKVRSVRAGLKRLEDRGHLECVSAYRGGRQSNRYRIIVKDEAITDAIYKSGANEPLTAEQTNRGDRKTEAGVTGKPSPVTLEQLNRGTPERTPEKTNAAHCAPADDVEDHRGPRVSAEAAQKILREAFGANSVTETGHVQRPIAKGGKRLPQVM